MNEPTELQLMSQAAWLYYLGGLNQEETSTRLGLTRARVNKLLQQARESGVVSIIIDDREIGLIAVEQTLKDRFGLEFCICTPAFGLSDTPDLPPALAEFPRRAVGAAAAKYLRGALAENPALVIGTGWGRTLEQVTRHLAGISAPQARFVSLMGSLTANSAFNPFEVVQAFSRITGGEGYFLPVPFIVDTPEDRELLMSQRTVAAVMAMAHQPDIALISVGELTEKSLLRSEGMISAEEANELRLAGAVGDTNGIFFDRSGRPVDHPLNQRTLAVGLEDLRSTCTVLLAAGVEKLDATMAILKSGVIKGMIIDGDSALVLAGKDYL